MVLVFIPPLINVKIVAQKVLNLKFINETKTYLRNTKIINMILIVFGIISWIGYTSLG